MFCRNCGKEIREGAAFCNFCGAKVVQMAIPAEPPKAEPVPVIPAEPPKVEPVPVIPAEPPKAEPVPVIPAAPPMAEPIPAPPTEVLWEKPAPAAPAAKPAPKQKKEKKKVSKGKVILLSILAVVLISAIVLACSLFPLNVTVEKSGSTTTHTGVFEKVELVIQSNQPILSVSYALNPDDATLYIDAETEGGLLEKTVTIRDLHIAPGESKLRLIVQTWFGSYEHTVKLKCDIGTIQAPKAEDIVNLYWNNDEPYLIVDEEILVGFKDGTTEKNAEKLIQEHGGEIIGAIYPVNMYQVHFEGIALEELSAKLEEFQAEESVEYAIYNSVYDMENSEAFPNDSEYDDWDTDEPGGNNWHLECIDAPGAWEYQDKFSIVDVGVLDTTLFYDHEDLQVNLDRYYYLPTDDFPTVESLNERLKNHTCVFVDGKCNMCSMYTHGTHVAGIIGAIANNNKGVAGTNWNTKLHFSNAWYVRADEDTTIDRSGTIANYSYSITHMVMEGCRVINMSLGSTEASSVGEYESEDVKQFDDVVAKLEKAGYDFLIVKSAGNKGKDASLYRLNRVLTSGETARKHVIIVGAIAHSGVDLTPFDLIPTQYNMAAYSTWGSNYGALVDIVAPGVDIYSTMPDGYGYLSGTSMAAPVVSGVAAMVYGVNPDLTSQEVKEILTECVSMQCPYKKQNYPIVNARMAVERAMGILKEEDIPQTQEIGFITGLVQDAATLNILDNALVRLVNNETGAEQVATLLENGTYYIYAVPGNYTMYFSAENYIEEIVYDVEITSGVETYNVLLNMVPAANTSNPTGTASGRVVDAFDAYSIPNATISVYRGVNNKDGVLVTSVQADEYGYYELELAPGNYTLRTSAEGYTSATANMIIVAGSHKANQDCTLTPILNPGEIRVVLTWGEYPRDLDSHIVGPYPDGYRFHVFYSSKNAFYNSERYVNLDVDDTTSYGPETTSVYMGVPGGTYTFYVHDFSNRNLTSSNGIATSGAVVTVYVGGVEEPYVFNAPAKDGTLWEVFTITDGVLTPVNEMTYHNTASSVGQ